MDTAVVRDTSAINNLSDVLAFGNAPFYIYPDPAKTGIAVSYYVPEKSTAEIAICDISGKKIAYLIKGIHAPGNYTYIWDCSDMQGNPVKSGVYFCRYINSGIVNTAKIVIIRP
jgi:hypothetical protein